MQAPTTETTYTFRITPSTDSARTWIIENQSYMRGTLAQGRDLARTLDRSAAGDHGRGHCQRSHGLPDTAVATWPATVACGLPTTLAPVCACSRARLGGRLRQSPALPGL